MKTQIPKMQHFLSYLKLTWINHAKLPKGCLLFFHVLKGFVCLSQLVADSNNRDTKCRKAHLVFLSSEWPQQCGTQDPSRDMKDLNSYQHLLWPSNTLSYIGINKLSSLTQDKSPPQHFVLFMGFYLGLKEIPNLSHDFV